LNGPLGRVWKKTKAWYNRERARFKDKGRVKLGWMGFTRLCAAIEQLSEKWGLDVDIEAVLDECVDLALTYAENVEKLEKYMLRARMEKEIVEKPRVAEEMVNRAEEEVREWLREQLLRMGEEIIEEVERLAPRAAETTAAVALRAAAVDGRSLYDAMVYAHRLQIEAIGAGRRPPITNHKYEDFICRGCGEAWTWEAVWSALMGEPSELTREQAEQFMRGLGCPKCRER